MEKKRVLLIEDNDDISEIVRWVLEDEGYEVRTTRHLPVYELAKFKADLIVLDEWINDKEGHMFCSKIKALQELKHIPVIIFSTANNIEEIVRTCNANGFIRKPFDVEMLLAEVERCLPTYIGKDKV